MITKSLAGVAAGVLLIGGGALATAQADPAPESTPVATSAPESQTLAGTTAADADYPAPTGFDTTTSLTLHDGLIQFGAVNNARVVVDGVATTDSPTGTVRITADGHTRTGTLHSGVAVVALPLLAVGTHDATATYVPANDSFGPSSSTTDSYKVVKSGSRLGVDATRISSGERPVVHTHVTTTTGVAARGSVTVRITNGKARDTETATLRDGMAVVRFPKVNRTGQWSVSAVYKGSATVASDNGGDSFRCTR
jgi:hypothetical protein